MVMTENRDDDENYSCDNYIQSVVRSSEDSSNGDKIILRTMTVILPVKIMISNGKQTDTCWCFKFRFLCVIFLSSIFYCSLRINNDTSAEEKARAISLSKVRCYRSAFLVMFITFPEVSSRILRMLPPACHKICQV